MKTVSKLLVLLLFASAFAITSCNDSRDKDDLIRFLRHKKEQKKTDKRKDDRKDTRYDCPRLKLNFKDKCRTADGKVGFVNKHCRCQPVNTDKRYDCKDLKLNFGDRCKTAAGVIGIVNKHCKCETKNHKRFDCEDLKLNIGDSCYIKNSNSGHVIKGKVGEDCKCHRLSD